MFLYMAPTKDDDMSPSFLVESLANDAAFVIRICPCCCETGSHDSCCQVGRFCLELGNTRSDVQHDLTSILMNLLYNKLKVAQNYIPDS